MNPAFIIKKPLITEKSLKLAKRGTFTFQVSPSATKHQITHTIQQVYSVTVTSITTTAIPAKSYKTGKRRLSKLSSPGKKAFVTLKPGQKINLFEIEET